MQEVFYEETALTQNVKSSSTKYYIFKTLSLISYAIALIWLIFAISFFPSEGNILINILFAAIPAAMFIGSGFFFGRIKDKFYVDYDYTFITGSIRFSKVIKNVKRKKVLVFDVKNIEKIGKIDSSSYAKYSAMPEKKRVILTSNIEPAEGKDFYYMVVNAESQKYLFILECTETFLTNIYRFTGKIVFDDEFFKKKEQ